MTLNALLKNVAAGKIEPVYLVTGDLVVAEPQGQKLADALAEKAGCEVERYRRPATISSVLADLRTYSLFGNAKVILVVDSAILADQKGAAELIDQAADALPLKDPSDLHGRAREGASRLLQALRVFGVDPQAGSPADALSSLPKWAFEGGLKRSRKRAAKDVKKLQEGLETLLAAAREAELQGFAEGDLAELGAIVRDGLPDGHTLVLVEAQAAAKHPVRETLKKRKALVELGSVAAGKRGGWEGLEPLAEELAQETGVRIARDALTELAKRTLKATGDWKSKSVDAQSTSRFAAEYRKLAGLIGKGTINRQLVTEQIEDRGEQDVWKILDAVGAGKGAEAIAGFHRLLSSSDDVYAARLSFFALLARFCRQLTAIAGVSKLVGVPRGERNYMRFKDRLAPKLQGEISGIGKSPLAGIHAFQLHRAYLTASSMAGDEIAQLPDWVLRTELRVKGDSKDADAAIVELITRLVRLVR